MDKIFSNQAISEMHKIHHIHFVGIGGVGMGGIAEVLLHEGYRISGSDINENPITQRLQELGATVHTTGHDADYIAGANVVVVSSAIKSDNVEVLKAKALNIPLVPRAEMLAELMRFRLGIAVAGTHGKTTTTSLVASILAEDGLDPTFVIGGVLNSAGTNARLGSGKYLVAEADESDASFLRLMPTMAIVTNIDEDHMDTYHGDFNELKNSFIEFLHRLPFYGLAICCIENPVVKELLPRVARQTMSYGFSEDALIHAVDYTQTGIISHFKVLPYNDYDALEVQLNLPGKHNVLNALAAIAVSRELGATDHAIKKALAKFAGVGRRFQSLGEYPFESGSASVFDDYGHHPKEVAATIQAVRSSWPERRLVMIFQPHRYTRTRDLFDDFVNVLSEVDFLIMLDVYPAGEDPIPGADARALCRSIRNRGKIDPILVTDPEKISKVLDDVLSNNDLLFSQGAGSVSRIVRSLLKKNIV